MISSFFVDIAQKKLKINFNVDKYYKKHYNNVVQ